MSVRNFLAIMFVYAPWRAVLTPAMMRDSPCECAKDSHASSRAPKRSAEPGPGRAAANLT